MPNHIKVASTILAAAVLACLAVANTSGFSGDKTVDIRGIVKDITPGKPTAAGKGPLAVLLIEGEKQKDTAVDKASVKVTPTTAIKKVAGKDRKDAKLEDLKQGCKVEATFIGPVLESYPVQATAKEIVILEDPK